MLKFFISFSTFFFLLISCSASNRRYESVKRPELQLKISLEKKTFLKGEPIWVEIELQNKGKGVAKISTKNLGSLYTNHTLTSHIVDKDEATYPINLISCPASVGFDTITSGEIIVHKLNLLDYHYSKPFKLNKRSLNSNTYSIFSELFKGVLSNQIIFEIKDPQGIDSVKFDLMNQGLKEFKNLSKMREIFDQLNEIDEESPYTEFLLYELIVFTSFSDKEKSSELANVFLEKYPNSNFVERVKNKLTYN